MELEELEELEVELELEELLELVELDELEVELEELVELELELVELEDEDVEDEEEDDTGMIISVCVTIAVWLGTFRLAARSLMIVLNVPLAICNLSSSMAASGSMNVVSSNIEIVITGGVYLSNKADLILDALTLYATAKSLDTSAVINDIIEDVGVVILGVNVNVKAFVSLDVQNGDIC